MVIDYPVLSSQPSFITASKMSQEGAKQQNTAYGVFVQACWAQHKRQYPDELIHKRLKNSTNNVRFGGTTCPSRRGTGSRRWRTGQMLSRPLSIRPTRSSSRQHRSNSSNSNNSNNS